MSHLKTIHSSLKIIQEAYQKLESGELTMEELDQFVNATQELLERAVILRYKAYENKIANVQPLENQELQIDNFTQDTIQIEKTPISDEPSVFEIEVEQPEPMEIHFESTVNEDPVPTIPLDLFNDNAEAVRTQILDEETVEHLNITSTSFEENGVVEEHVIMEQVKRTPVEAENKEFIEKFAVVEADLFNQIGMSRLETLTNCFGLNEKFLYINELFNGSKDDFNEAVQQIDNDSSYHDALLTASIYANKNNWDTESSIVQDFVTKLKRRHG
jgi:hypothetical protein